MQTAVMETSAVAVEILGDASISVPGRLDEMTEGYAQLCVSHLIPTNSRVRVLLSNDETVEGRVTSRNPVDGGYEIGVYLKRSNPQEQRKEARIPVASETASVMALEGDVTERISAVVQDISKSGVGLFMAKRISPGTWVKVELRHSLIFGEAKYCTPLAEGQYRVGITTNTVVYRDAGMRSRISRETADII